MPFGVRRRASWKQRLRLSPLAPPDAYAFCVLAPREALAAALAERHHPDASLRMLDAALRCCDGDVVGAENVLRRAADLAPNGEREYLVDLLTPLLVDRGLYGRAATLVAAPTLPVLEGARAAALALVASAAGDAASAERRAAEARARAAECGDDVQRMRVCERLGRAALCGGDARGAACALGEALRCAHALGADRAAASIHAAAYALHRTATGDAERAWRHLRLQERDAARGGDAGAARAARVELFELAVERGDDADVAAARRALEREPIPERHRARFGRVVADALTAGWRDDFADARATLQSELERPARSEGERALARALLALAAVALGDERPARRHARAASAVAIPCASSAPAEELRRRRLARVLGSLAARLARAALRDARSGLEIVGGKLGGYERFVLAVRRRLARRPSNGPLTATETDVLRLVADGHSAPEIARLLGRSTHTVRTHLRNIGMKLDAHGRDDAVRRARELGVLPPP